MKKLRMNHDADATMVGGVVAGLVAIIIGVLIWYKLDTAMYSAAGVLARSASNTAAMNATRTMQTAIWNSTNASANTVWTLFPIVAIVVVAGVILAVVMGFGRNSA